MRSKMGIHTSQEPKAKKNTWLVTQSKEETKKKFALEGNEMCSKKKKKKVMRYFHHSQWFTKVIQRNLTAIIFWEN